jgi:hypothetical protein
MQLDHFFHSRELVMMRYSFLGCLSCILACLSLNADKSLSQDAQTVDSSVIETFLIEGKLSDGEAALKAAMEKSPESDQLKMEMGFLQFFQSVERMGQTLYSYGPASSFAMGQIPFLRLPVPDNPDPKPVKLKHVRKMIQTFINDLDRVEKTLAGVDSNAVKLPIRIMQVKLDFNADGRVSNKESLGPVLLQYLGGRRPNNGQLNEMMKKSISFDRADVDWLRGYCCLLRSMGEIFLAHDATEFWDVVAHRIFEKGNTKYDFLLEEEDKNDFYAEVIDIVAAIHNIRFPVQEPERLKLAHQHLLDTIKHSRSMWKRINAETDDDREWIPSPKQSNPFTEVRITRRMTDSWSKFLDEGEQILTGKLLVPFWRGSNEKRGVDLHQVFHEPEDFDLVLWIHGSGVTPFIKMGECSRPATWTEFQRVFQGNFFGFAVWFN